MTAFGSKFESKYAIRFYSGSHYFCVTESKLTSKLEKKLCETKHKDKELIF